MALEEVEAEAVGVLISTGKRMAVRAVVDVDIPGRLKLAGSRASDGAPASQLKWGRKTPDSGAAEMRNPSIPSTCQTLSNRPFFLLVDFSLGEEFFGCLKGAMGDLNRLGK